MKLSVTLTVALTVAVLSSACEEPPPPMLEVGRWFGTVLPIGEPENSTEVYYRVSYPESGLEIVVGTPGADSRPARDIQLTIDTLRFVFDEPEAEMPLECALGLQPNGNYEGLCEGGEGKSAYFTMRPPDPFGGEEA